MFAAAVCSCTTSVGASTCAMIRWRHLLSANAVHQQQLAPLCCEHVQCTSSSNPYAVCCWQVWCTGSSYSCAICCWQGRCASSSPCEQLSCHDTRIPLLGTSTHCSTPAAFPARLLQVSCKVPARFLQGRLRHSTAWCVLPIAQLRPGRAARTRACFKGHGL
jgi:hypothetical protein